MAPKPWKKNSTPPGFLSKKEKEDARFEAEFERVIKWIVSLGVFGFLLAVLDLLLNSKPLFWLGFVFFCSAISLALIVAVFGKSSSVVILNQLKDGIEIRIKMFWHALVGPRK